VQPLAFFRFEGVLTARPAALAAAWLAARSQDLGTRAARLGAVGLSVPFFWGPARDPTTARRLAWSALRGFSEDRLAELGDEYRERFIDGNLRPVGLDLLERCRSQGYRIALLTELVAPVAQGIATRLRVADLVCNHLEIVDGRATGRLMDPLVGALDARWARDFAAARKLDLAGARAYGASGDDAVLLAAVDGPCAVAPDRDLRRVARDCSWPTVDA
jgi:phosphoserine phosphatase